MSPPSFSVTLARPAGSVASGPLSVPSSPADVRVDRDRSSGKAFAVSTPSGSKAGSLASSRAWSGARSGPPSLRVTFCARSALPVTDQRQRAFCPLRDRPRRPVSPYVRLVRAPSPSNPLSTESALALVANGLVAGTVSVPVGRPNRLRPSVCDASAVSVAEASPSTVRLIVAVPRTSRCDPTKVRKERGSAGCGWVGTACSAMLRSRSVSALLVSAWRVTCVRPAVPIISRETSARPLA